MSAAKIKRNSEELRKIILPALDEDYVKHRQRIYKRIESTFELNEKNWRERQTNLGQVSNALENLKSAVVSTAESLQIIEETTILKKEELQALCSINTIDLSTLPNETKKLADLISYYRDIRTKLEIVRKTHHDRLGMKIEKIGENIKFSFEYIARDRKTEHSVTLALNNEKYQIVSCIPEIPRLQDLEMELNWTLSLGTFLKKVRKEFTKLYV
ncbi:unnamed protein product [Blepharisma stoltei]|uniref:Kinetochore protein SPC25 n=1 Tax=Blepharisma stoltei TaxID=1481888 RepID=A0AAU9JYN0_9CILI|nr:unnamed protein product [Blepharisma stoltei]